MRTSCPTAPVVRAAQMVAASTLLQPNRDRGHHRLGIEDGERGGHDLAGHLAHDRAAAGEVGRAVGELHAARRSEPGLGEKPSAA